MATSPIGGPRTGASSAGTPPSSGEAPGPRRQPAHAGLPSTRRQAASGPPPPRGTLPAGSLPAQVPTARTLQRLERQFDALPPTATASGGNDSQRAAVRALTDLALRIAHERAALPREEAVRGLSDMKFVRIMVTAVLRKQKHIEAAISTYNAAVAPVQAQIERDTAAYLGFMDKHAGSTGKARYVAWIAGADRAGRIAAQAQELIRHGQALQQDLKEQIALCEAAQSVRWTLDRAQLQEVESTLLTMRLYQFDALSRQVHNHGKSLLWDCVNPYPLVFAELEFEKLIPVVEKLTTYDALAIVNRVSATTDPAQHLLQAAEREAIDTIRTAAAGCAARMGALADQVETSAGTRAPGDGDLDLRQRAIEHLRHLEDTGWELADMARSPAAARRGAGWSGLQRSVATRRTAPARRPQDQDQTAHAAACAATPGGPGTGRDKHRPPQGHPGRPATARGHATAGRSAIAHIPIAQQGSQRGVPPGTRDGPGSEAGSSRGSPAAAQGGRTGEAGRDDAAARRGTGVLGPPAA